MIRGYSLPLSPGGTRVARAGAAVALRRRLPGDRVLGRPRRGARRAAARPRAATPTTPAARRRSSSTGSSCSDGGRASCSTRCAASTRSSSSSSTRCWATSRSRPARTSGSIADFALVRGWIQGFPKKLGLDLDDAQLRARLPRPSGRTFGGTLRPTTGGWPRARSRSSRLSDSGPTHNDPPLVNVRHFPRLAAGRHDEPGGARAGARAQPRPLDLGHPRGLGDARAVPRARRGAHRARAGADGQGLSLPFAYTVDDLETVGG